MPFFASFVTCFPATLGCSDCVYNEISIVPTKFISNPVSKFLLEKSYEVSNFAFSGCSAGSPHQAVSPSVGQSISNFSTNFEHSPIVWFEWNFLRGFILGWHLLCLNFLSKFLSLTSHPLPYKSFPLILNTYPLSDLDETSYIDLFGRAFATFAFFFISPTPEFPTP